MKERLQKILASHAIASRRQAEEMIKAGRVCKNGVVCQLGDSADTQTDIIQFDGKPLPPAGEHIYIMLHKPRGYVTTLSDEKGRKNVAQLVRSCNCRVYPVGRLDMDSEGLLLLTNDGNFANLLMHPKHQINKTYQVNVTNFSEVALQRLSEPMYIDGYLIQKPSVCVIKQTQSSAVLQITIHEGRNRQIRKMCALAGMQIKRLIRISEGSVVLGELPVGKWRYLTQAEVDKLIKNL